MIEVIPAIDVIDGEFVRLKQGDFRKITKYPESIIDTALRYEAVGAKKLHLIDLIGSKTGSISITPLIKKIASMTNLKIQTGGGIRSLDDIDSLLNAGASRVILGTFAFSKPGILEEVFDEFGSEKIIIGADFKGETIRTAGWMREEKVSLDEYVSEAEQIGFKNFLITDIAKDGMMSGPATRTYQNILATYNNINLIASGGISSIADIKNLESAGITQVIVGKALAEGVIKPEDLFKRGQQC
jgi:phosphoribosylformimino-5-aminoimidazole carboxamide ribotide isomerase